uniref:Uncharacterized protein n=1 Tax=Oryzias sinensis TaxID=183150 RepID=A0A8C7WSA7_9TELE
MLCLHALCDGRSPVIIDNTNLEAWEMKPYVKMVSHLFVQTTLGLCRFFVVFRKPGGLDEILLEVKEIVVSKLFKH